MKVDTQQLKAEIEPLAAVHGVELVALEWLQGPGRGVLRLYIDRPGTDPRVDAEQGSGATADVCARLSRDVSAALDKFDEEIPTAYDLEVSSPGFERPVQKREDFERLLIQTVAAARPDRVVLAGWMLLLSPLFLDAFPDRVINLHPALPGAFPGTDAIARAWQAGARGEIQHTGVMVHRVVPEMDAGPVLATEIVPLRPGEPQADLEARVHEVEHRLLIRALQAEACAALSPA